jgi:formate--tetrahydrofolate ligase
MQACATWGVPAQVARVWEQGGAGGVLLARAIDEVMTAKVPGKFKMLYPDDMPLEQKIRTIATALYGADGVVIMPAAQTKLAKFAALGYGRLPVCMAKTQNSLSDDPKQLGRPRGFTVTVRDVKLAAGAGFVIAYLGDIMTMPGLPKKPAAESIDIDANGRVVGLF